MSWLTLTILAQFLNSIVALFDKYLVTSKKVTSPLLYVFYTGALACLGILIYVPQMFGSFAGFPSFSNVGVLPIGLYLVLLLAIVCQLGALWAMFSCLRKNDASDVVPVIGSMSAVFALIIGFFAHENFLPTNFAIGFALLTFGTFLISHLRFSMRTFLLTVMGGLGFALHSILLKVVLHATSFDTGFFWLSLSTSLFSILLLCVPTVRKALKSQKGEKHIKTTGALLVSNKVVAGIAGILLIKAIEIGEVSLVQALGGLQFVFLFVFAAMLGPITSIDFGENVKKKDLYHKLTAISIIFLGFVLLFI